MRDSRRRLLDETGIDFASYRELVALPDVTGALVDAVTRAALWASGLFVGVIVVIAMLVRRGAGPLSTLVLGILGVSVVGAAAAGVWISRLGAGLEAQALELTSIARDAAGRMHEDLSNAGSSLSDRQLAEGVLLVAVTPALGDTVQNRFPLIGNPLGNLTEWIVGGVFRRLMGSFSEGHIGESVSSLTARIVSITERMEGFVTPVVARFRRWVIRPLVLFLRLIVLACVALFVLTALAAV